ncbi:MAG: DUF1549 domain-containing protein [Akkermansiaceae bacterium]|nr:DUF1549 domain-containing protein [Akkermansiaceae bacterium]
MSNPSVCAAFLRFPLAGVVCALAAGAAGQEAKPVDFAHEIVPVLKKRCGECHLGDKKKGGFSLNTREDLLAGGENGEVLEPGKGAASLFVELMTTDDADIQMPPKGDRVPGEEIALLSRWIDEKLPWEAGFAFDGAAWEPPLKPRTVELPAAATRGRDHPIDRLLDAYLAKHGVETPEPVEDAVFLRRLHLDTIGLPPTPEELAAFLADSRPDKRARAIDAALARDVDYAEHWLSFWNDLLRNDYAGTGFIDGGRKQITNWLYRSLIDNKPYDQFVRELIAPDGESEGFIKGIQWRGAVNASQTREIQFAQNLSQIFLGINMKCASCHDSFTDRWKIQDAYGLASVVSETPVEIHRCDKGTGEFAEPAWIYPELGQVTPGAPREQRLREVAGLLTSRENGRFARTVVNRLWHRMMGRGIVHPVDAMHTEPWSEDLLDWLAADFVEHGHDLRHALRRIATSAAYQSRMAPTPDPKSAEKYVYRGPIARRLTAEQFLDAVWAITDTAPAGMAADFLRMKIEPGQFDDLEVTGKWIWSDTADPPAAGETISVRKVFDLKEKPTRAASVISVDNEYTLYVNGQKAAADTNWMTVEMPALEGRLKKGSNEILIVAKNGGEGPNAAGVYFEMRMLFGEGAPEERLATDATWEWTARQPNAKGEFGKAVTDWQPARARGGGWAARLDPQVRAGLASAEGTGDRRVRAALVKSDLLQRSLGRPNREQVVTVRPEELSTLQAIDLANGDLLAGLLKRGAENLLKSAEGRDAEAVAERIFLEAVSRPPTPEEKAALGEIASAGLSPQAVEDMLWAVLMLPEFQLVR